MSLWAIVPVKPLRRGKSRLSGVLSEEERTQLNFSMLANTLKTLTSTPGIDQTLVVSRDTAVLGVARDFGVRTLLEDGRSDLNTALRRATVVAQMYAVRSVLVLPADLPLLNTEDLLRFLLHMTTPPVMVISPDRRLDGTNALLTSPPGLIDFQFGPNSFQKHVQQGESRRIHVEVCEMTSLGLDLDVPEDLELLRHMEEVEIKWRES